MKIIVDGDACPSKDIIKSLAKKYEIEVHIFVDSSHYFEDDFFTIHLVSKGKDAVDIALINYMENGDLIITQDYGVAAIAICKTNFVVNPIGFRYTNKNIDELLFKRHITSKSRRSGKGVTKIKKRSKENDENFYMILEKLLKQITSNIESTSNSDD